MAHGGVAGLAARRNAPRLGGLGKRCNGTAGPARPPPEGAFMAVTSATDCTDAAREDAAASSLPLRWPCHQNSQRPVEMTQTPSSPFVTACAMTAVHSLPLLR